MNNEENSILNMPIDPHDDRWDMWSAQPEPADEFEGWRVLKHGRKVAQFFARQSADDYMKMHQVPTAEYPIGVPGYEVRRTVAPFVTEGELAGGLRVRYQGGAGMTTLIDSLKRLERAGGENSRATAKLHEAVREVADLIERTVPHNLELPRGYRVEDRHSNVGATTLLYRATGELDPYDYDTDRVVTECIDYDGPRYLHGDFNTDMHGDGQTRAKSLQFAKDVAEGLLPEIADFLERRAEETLAAAEGLERASEAVQA